MKDPTLELSALRERIAQLENAYTALASQLDELRAALAAPKRHSMRDSRRCPACGGQALLHIPRTTQVGHESIAQLGLYHEWKVWSGAVARGAMETFACRTCGIVELHVTQLDDVKIDGDRVRAVDPEPEPPHDGPFR